MQRLVQQVSEVAADGRFYCYYNPEVITSSCRIRTIVSGLDFITLLLECRSPRTLDMKMCMSFGSKRLESYREIGLLKERSLQIQDSNILLIVTFDSTVESRTVSHMLLSRISIESDFSIQPMCLNLMVLLTGLIWRHHQSLNTLS